MDSRSVFQIVKCSDSVFGEGELCAFNQIFLNYFSCYVYWLLIYPLRTAASHRSIKLFFKNPNLKPKLREVKEIEDLVKSKLLISSPQVLTFE